MSKWYVAPPPKVRVSEPWKIAKKHRSGKLVSVNMKEVIKYAEEPLIIKLT